jgi:3',5'-cyclic AMP phosphodiesterase CpdA
MSEKKSITILHLSDIQFGANHRFGVDVKTVDGSIETLLGRFTDDLKEMRDDYGLTPELIVLTGDLVEWAGMIKIQSERLFGLSPLQVCSPCPSARSGEKGASGLQSGAGGV